MPFEACIPQRFNARSAQYYAPPGPGVYGLSNARGWVFIGQADDVQAAILYHLRAMDNTILQFEPTGFVYESCSGDQRRMRLEQLVKKYAPVCNQPFARPDDSTLRRGNHG